MGHNRLPSQVAMTMLMSYCGASRCMASVRETNEELQRGEGHEGGAVNEPRWA